MGRWYGEIGMLPNFEIVRADAMAAEIAAIFVDCPHDLAAEEGRGVDGSFRMI
jgi:hypothetical protein